MLAHYPCMQIPKIRSSLPCKLYSRPTSILTSNLQATAYSNAVKRASPTRTVAPAFENDIPVEALEALDDVEAGAALVLEEDFPVALVLEDFPDAFAVAMAELLEPAVRGFPVGRTTVVIAEPLLLTVRVCPSPVHVVEMYPWTDAVASNAFLGMGASQPVESASLSRKRMAASDESRLSRRQVCQKRASTLEVMLQ